MCYLKLKEEWILKKIMKNIRKLYASYLAEKLRFLSLRNIYEEKRDTISDDKKSLSFWQTTMTKKIVWISILLTISLWIIDILFLVLSSPTLLSIPESAVIEYTSSCKQVTVGMFATIVFYFIRAFLDSWNKARTGLDVSDDNFTQLNSDDLFDSVNQMVQESNDPNM